MREPMPNRDRFQNQRKEYQVGVLDENTLQGNPIDLFNEWYGEIVRAGGVEPNAFALATCMNNLPSVRFVLMKNLDDLGLTFFTNYESRKGKELLSNPHCSGVFYWGELERQVRFEGVVRKLHYAESNSYFAQRKRDAQIAVYASRQSEVVSNRATLEMNYRKFQEAFQDQEIDRPAHWGGYQINLVSLEFWQGRVGRLHDRIRYSLEGEFWTKERLSP